MKTKTYLIVILFFVVLNSCKKDKYYFSNEELNFIPYEKGDEFNWLKSKLKDTLICQVTSKDIFHEETMYALHLRPTYVNVCNVLIEAKGVRAKLDYYKTPEGFTFEITTIDESTSMHKIFFPINDADSVRFTDSVEINQLFYTDVTLLIGETDTLYYSREFGILEFSDSESGNDYILLK